ncbi:hypothetical protein LRAMOSA11484 [Lichtheimia ramosa]|uniref:Uncharacterized protein n=1 Tax=Lichtheimia ramosa TaxID=688394 RepID=A0A077WX69_9FUNG|nr:hypothetical protein LRAMOSA11484 [Lichtheimia ramosa]
MTDEPMTHMDDGVTLSASLLGAFANRDIKAPEGRVKKAHILTFINNDMELYAKLTDHHRDEILDDFFHQAASAGLNAMELGWEDKELSLLRVRALLEYEAYARTQGCQSHRCIGNWVANFLLQSKFYYRRKVNK